MCGCLGISLFFLLIGIFGIVLRVFDPYAARGVKVYASFILIGVIGLVATLYTYLRVGPKGRVS